jgi:hypothetical protein
VQSLFTNVIRERTNNGTKWQEQLTSVAVQQDLHLVQVFRNVFARLLVARRSKESRVSSSSLGRRELFHEELRRTEGEEDDTAPALMPSDLTE